MKKWLKKSLRLLRKPTVIIGLIVVVSGSAIFISTRNNNQPQYESVIAERQDITQEVSVTGRVNALEDIDLSFEKTGTVGKVYVNVGDQVTAGQTLVSLRNSDISALLNQAEAQVQAARAVLAELTNNADSEQALKNAYGNVLNTINDALAKSEDAVRTKSADVFSGSEVKGYTLTFNPCESSVSLSARALRLKAELELDEWNRELRDFPADPSNNTLDSALTKSQAHLDVIRQFVNATNAALVTNCALDYSSLDTARTNMTTAQTNVLTAISNVNSLAQSIASKKISVNNYDEVSAQEAKVKAAEASADNYRVQFSQTILKSPINGVVAKQDAKVGEAVSINVPVAKVISASGFEVEVNIPEADIAKVKLGDKSKVTLDAYGDDALFEAEVVSIDPAETIIEGVATYKTTLQFSEKDDRIKSGMTANLDILTAERHSVIAIPQRAVITKDGQKTVRLLGDNNEVTEVNVQTGLRGSDGKIEILSGVNEGDKVITLTKEG